MLAACCAVLVSGVGFVLFVLDELAQLCDRTLERLKEFGHLVTVAVLDAVDVGADCQQEVVLIERIERYLLVAHGSINGCSVDRDARLVFKVVACGLLDFHCVVCVVC